MPKQGVPNSSLNSSHAVPYLVFGAFVQSTRKSSSIVVNSLRDKVPSLFCWLEVWKLMTLGNQERLPRYQVIHGHDG